MQDDEFEWDDAKSAANLAKHKIDFVFARRVFDDDNAFSGHDRASSDDEERYFVTGVVDGRAVTVIYSYRGERTRIISARSATRREINDYYRS